jgi:hypothetical protein
MKRALAVVIAALLAIGTTAAFRGLGVRPVTPLPRGPVVDWSLEEVKRLGRFDSTARADGQTIDALCWTDHDLRQWNEGMLRLAADRGLDLVRDGARRLFPNTRSATE